MFICFVQKENLITLLIIRLLHDALAPSLTSFIWLV
jgi:hypothetical protein